MSEGKAAHGEIKVGPLDDLPVGLFRVVQAGREEIGVIRLRNGEIHAIRNYCPHRGAPICRGIVGGTWPPSDPGRLTYERDGEILVCPWHGWEFDIRTGEELYQPTPSRVRKFPVDVRDGEVFVAVRS